MGRIGYCQAYYGGDYKSHPNEYLTGRFCMNASIKYGDREIHYEVVRTATLVKKILIHVHPNATVEVEAPDANPIPDINVAVRKRARWICKQLDMIADTKKYVMPREYISGETHFYIGRRYSLKVITTREDAQTVKLRSGRIEVITRINDPVVIRKRLKKWYTEKSEDYFQKRLHHISQNIDWIQDTPSFKLIKMQKQWGSCSPEGVIHLNPWLIRAPSECIDYVITHELCHLKERNHSKKYYALLEKYYPNWEHVKTKLDGMAELLLAE
jgi:predicted metal-dependent hydrolase